MTNMRLICFQHLSASQITVHISTYSQAALALPIGNPFSSYQQLHMYTFLNTIFGIRASDKQVYKKVLFSKNAYLFEQHPHHPWFG
jgi:hypothetical protein